MRSLLFNLFFYSFTVAIAFAMFVAAKISTQRRLQRIAGFWGRTVLGGVRRILGSEVEIQGLENLPEGPVLLVSKHQSELDIVVLAALFPNAAAVAMEELTRYPFFGPILRGLDVVLVAIEQGPQGRTEQVIEGTRRVLGQGRPMMIYPEGELMRLGARERYRRGAAHIYTRLNPVTVPVANSLGAVWRRREWVKPVGRKGAIRFLEPMPEGLSFEAFQMEIERRIEQGSMALVRECVSGEELAEAEARFARGVNNHGEAIPRGTPPERVG